jgi:hypothetical protein
VELAETLHAIAKVLRHIPPDHPASARTVDELRKEIRAIAAGLRRDWRSSRKALPQLLDSMGAFTVRALLARNVHDPRKKCRYSLGMFPN